MKKYVMITGKLLSVFSIFFIIYSIWKIGLDFSCINNWNTFLIVVFIGTTVKALTVFMSGYVWARWVSFFANQRIDVKEALRIYSKANTGKYLPGNVMHYVERNLFADKMGIGQIKIAASSLIEIISLVLVAFITAFLLSVQKLELAITVVHKTMGNYFLFIVLGIPIIGLLGTAIIVHIFKKKVLEILKEYSIKKFIIQLLYSMLIEAAVLGLLGLVLVLLYVFMGGKVTYQDGMEIIAGYVIAWVLGFVVPGAPGGIGIRELVLTLLLGANIGKTIIMSIILIHRLITIIGDFLAYVIGMIVCRDKTA